MSTEMESQELSCLSGALTCTVAKAELREDTTFQDNTLLSTVKRHKLHPRNTSANRNKVYHEALG